jgi:S-formylglutathione hydrolase
MIDLDAYHTDLLDADLEYAVLRPNPLEADLPVMYLLHGGGGDRNHLSQIRPLIERDWERGRLPRALVVTPSVERSFYMNFRDGSRRYEDLLAGPFLDHIRTTYDTATDRERTVIVGISMGGMGGLRLAFKHPDVFGAVAALEPGIEPALEFGDIEPRDRFYREDALYEQIYGEPIDTAYWADNNPATIAHRDPRRLADAGLSIFLECGDEDSFGLHRGAEFLHRVLFDGGVPHEHRLLRGADHLGRTLGPRYEAALSFIGSVLDPPPPDETLRDFHAVIQTMKQRGGVD